MSLVPSLGQGVVTIYININHPLRELNPPTPLLSLLSPLSLSPVCPLTPSQPQTKAAISLAPLQSPQSSVSIISDVGASRMLIVRLSLFLSTDIIACAQLLIVEGQG